MHDMAAQSIALSLGMSSLVTFVCRRARVPALLPLLVVGLGMGVSGLGLIDANSLGGGLKGFITVAIGLLIFEGAMHLNREELSHSPKAVWRLLTIGGIVTWIGAALAARFALGFEWPISVLLGATLIVTGPTVVQPILRLVRVSPRLHTALSAEAVLIDPLGVVATITTLEVIRLYATHGLHVGLAGEGLVIFVKPLLGGAGVGLVVGLLGYGLLKAMDRYGKADPQILNLAVIGICMLCVGLGEAITPEAGLASVTICGIIMARARVIGATELRSFKELLATILVGTLFLLLASRFSLIRMQALTWRDAAFIACLLFVVRPLCVLSATFGSALNRRERVFASFFAPRGIVALSVASVAASELGAVMSDGGGVLPTPVAAALLRDVNHLEVIMFATIIVSVVIATVGAPLMSWALGIGAGKGNAVLLVGAHGLGEAFARSLIKYGIHVRIADSNEARVGQCTAQSLDAVLGDATNTRWLDDVASPHDAGWVISWTGNDTVDQVVARWGEERFGPTRAVLWSNKPARNVCIANDWGQNVGLESVLEQLERGELRLIESDAPTRLVRLFACIDNGVLTLATSAAARGERKGRLYLGLADALSTDDAPLERQAAGSLVETT